METFFIIGFGILISFVLICILQYIGEDMGDMFYDGFYGNSFNEKFKKK